MLKKTMCSEAKEQIVVSHCVHMVIELTGHWESDREQMVMELERKVAAVETYVASASFRKEFGARCPVLRVQAEGPAPSIVEHLLAEEGIEIEDTTATRSEGLCCVDCGRDKLPETAIAMSAHGWVCRSCDRARRRGFVRARNHTQLGFLSIPAPLVWPVLAVITLGFFVGVGYELRNLGTINQSIKTPK